LVFFFYVVFLLKSPSFLHIEDCTFLVFLVESQFGWAKVQILLDLWHYF
jgi:hypothetical protein